MELDRYLNKIKELESETEDEHVKYVLGKLRGDAVWLESEAKARNYLEVLNIAAHAGGDCMEIYHGFPRADWNSICDDGLIDLFRGIDSKLKEEEREKGFRTY